MWMWGNFCKGRSIQKEKFKISLYGSQVQFSWSSKLITELNRRMGTPLDLILFVSILFGTFHYSEYHVAVCLSRMSGQSIRV